MRIQFRHGLNPGQVTDDARSAINNADTPEQAGIDFITGSTTGQAQEYVQSIISSQDIDKLEPSQSILIHCPTGSGKTKAITEFGHIFSKERQVIILTNRFICKMQLLRDLCKKFGYPDVPDDMLDKMKLSPNLECMTYQELVHHGHRFQGKKMLIILDEYHCLAEDSTFSVYAQQTAEFIRRNLDNTIRIYLTATPEDAFPIVWNTEAISEATRNGFPPPLTLETEEQILFDAKYQYQTRIRHIYRIPADWSYLKFRAYRPDDRESLTKYIRTQNEAGKKSLIFINDIEAGRKIQEQLGDSQLVYSDEDKKAELREIAVQERFESDSLITTKVAENGVSLHDDKLSVIVAETCDLVSLQQIIGRARVNLRHPREVEVLIPDYSSSDLGLIEGKIYAQLREFRKAAKNPDMAMQFLPQPNPYVYYSFILKKPVYNELGEYALERQLRKIQELKAEDAEHPHAFLRRVLSIYGKDTEITDSMYINYDSIKDCKSRIINAWETYKVSLKDENDLRILKESLKSACNETGAYGKELTSNIQIDTINKILEFAGIQEKVNPGHMVYDTSCPEEN